MERLSRSEVWKWQRRYFERQGIDAWRSGATPHHVTSSPFIANAYAKIVRAFIQDCRAGSAALDVTQPLYVVELGSGSGRFAHLFLKNLVTHQGCVNPEIPIKYVMTDFTERNLEYCRRHPWLQPFIQRGMLDFACFDVARDRKLRLDESGDTISGPGLKNPLVVIANYVFDSVPQDAFYVSGGELFETLVKVSRPNHEHSASSDSEILSHLEMSCQHQRVSQGYYSESAWNRILSDYQRRLDDVAFLFPAAALKCIGNLRRLSPERMLLLSGDIGYSDDDALQRGEGAPIMNVHGSVSMMVDYQIIGDYCRQFGARVLHPARRVKSLNISAFIFGEHLHEFSGTRQTYAETIEAFGPDDFATLKKGIAASYDALSFDQILAFLRLSCWDYKRFWECIPAFKKHLIEMSDAQKEDLREVILKVWDSYLPIGEENDLAFEMGTLLLEIDAYDAAIDFFKHSIALYGQAPGTAYNLGVCYYRLGEHKLALQRVRQALKLDPGFELARSFQAELTSAVSRKAIRSRRRQAAASTDEMQISPV